MDHLFASHTVQGTGALMYRKYFGNTGRKVLCDFFSSRVDVTLRAQDAWRMILVPG